MRYEAEYSGIRIKKECLKDLQNHSFNRKEKHYIVSIEGSSKDICRIISEIHHFKWFYEDDGCKEVNKKSFWRRNSAK